MATIAPIDSRNAGGGTSCTESPQMPISYPTKKALQVRVREAINYIEF